MCIRDSSYRCFYNCKALMEIPEELFTNCTSATNFSECFYSCDLPVSYTHLDVYKRQTPCSMTMKYAHSPLPTSVLKLIRKNNRTVCLLPKCN